MAVAAEALVRDRLYIGGEWVDPAGDGTIDVINPSTEEVVGRIPEGTAEDADRAVKAARAAFDSWSQTTPQERSDYMAAIGAKLGERGDELAALIATEMGMPLKLTRMIQVGLPTASFSLIPQLMGEVAVGGEGGQLADRARARRSGGGDHAVELPPPPDRQQGRPGAGRRLHGRAEAERGGPAQRVRARRDHRGGGAARGRLQPRHGHRPGGGRGDRVAPRHRHGLVHRLHPRGAARVRAGGAERQAGDARAGRRSRPT